MKRIGCILLLLALIFALCGCTKEIKSESSDRFVKIYHDIANCLIVYKDTITGVEYVRIGSGSPVVLLDQNGKPYINPEH